MAIAAASLPNAPVGATTDRRRTVAVVLAASLGIALACYVYFPGVMSNDSIWMYRQAITGDIDVSKPPLVASLWSLAVAVVPSPIAIVALHNLMFWSGLALVIRACEFRPLVSAAAVLAIGLWPPVFALLGTLWSDVLLGACLTLFVGMALAGSRSRSRILLAASLLPLWCALSARNNALPAILPLAAWLTLLWFRVTSRPVSFRTVATGIVVLTAGMTATSLLFRRAVASPPEDAPPRMIQFSLYHDLAGIAVHSGDLRMPAHVFRAIPDLDLGMIRTVYDPADANRLFYNEWWSREPLLTRDRAEFQDLVGVWAGAVRAHPGAYLERRAEATATMLQIRGVFYPFHTGIDPNDLGLGFRGGPVYERLTTWLTETRGVFFRGWMFAVAALLVAYFGMRARRWDAVAVAASGLFYVMPYILISNGSDFRFIWWLVVATLIALPLLFRHQRSVNAADFATSANPTSQRPVPATAHPE